MDEHKDFFIKSMSLLGLLLGAYCFYEILSAGNVWHCKGTMSVRILWASAHFLLLPFYVYSYKKWTFIGVCSSGLIILNLVLLFNRASLLALAVSAGVFAFYIKKLRYVVIAVLVIILIVCILNPHFLNSDSLKSRYAVWAGTATLFRENPFFGIGINNWELEIPRFASTFFEKDVFVKLFYQRPHNDFLWVLSEIGIFGSIGYAGIFGFGIFYAVKKRNVLALSGLAGYLVIAFFSFPKERAFHSMMLIAYLALATSGCKFKKIKAPLFAKVPVFIVLCLVVLEFSLCYNSMIHIRKMTIARDRKQWSKVLAESEKISSLKTMDICTIPIKWYTAEAHYFLGNHRQTILDSVQAFNYHPNNVYVLDRMGTLLKALGDIDGAESCYRRALNIQPNFEVSARNLKDLENMQREKI